MRWTDLEGTPHRRFNPLIREWVLVSPHRTARPWLGKVEKRASESPQPYAPDCYLCPGNARAGGARNPAYDGVFVFDNDYPAMLPDTPPGALDLDGDGLILARAEPGICRVVCFSPRHDLTIPRMTGEELLGVVDAWIEQYEELGAFPWIRHVQIFENRGAIMGASNPHPHCQVWANAEVPNQPAREQVSFLEYRDRGGGCLLCRYLELELERGERVVCENDGFVALAPFWAMWPFETLLLGRRHVASMADSTDVERRQLGDILRLLTIRYDNLFETPFPYSMGFHQGPTDGAAHPEWHLHAHYFPPLLRSATIQKFMVGYELLGSPQRDITPESAAARLRAAGDVHYEERGR
jgi:UDPglucose--hexose-1-phosphate uridylyltransferase